MAFMEKVSMGMPSTLTISFPDDEILEAFMSWLDNQGEQDYFQYVGDADVPSVGYFRYDYKKQHITATLTSSD